MKTILSFIILEFHSSSDFFSIPRRPDHSSVKDCKKERKMEFDDLFQQGYKCKECDHFTRASDVMKNTSSHIWVPKDRREIAAADGALLSCMAKPEILNNREVKYL